MLSTENADLAGRDPGIPGLALLLDPDALVNAIRPFLVVKGLIKATITYIRYKPATNCMVAYNLKIAGRPLAIYAKAFGVDADVKFKKARERKYVPGPFGPDIICLNDIGIVVSVFPNDSKLKTLRRLGERQNLRGILCHIFPDRPEFWDGTLHTLSYKPERRYVARLEVHGESQAVLKFYTKQAFPAACANLEVFKLMKSINMPKYLGSLESRWVLGTNWLKGHELSDILHTDDTEPAIRMIHDTGKALAELQDHEAVGLTCRSRDSEKSALFEISDKLGFLCPPLAEKSEVLVRYLAEWISAQPIINKPIHGDFYAKQVLVDNGQISVVDLDEVAFGDPRADLGLFIAHMELDVVRGLLSSEKIAPLTNALLAGYEHGTEDTIPLDVNVYTAVGLFQLAHSSFRRCEPAWPARTKAILDKAEMYINTSSIMKSKDSKLWTVNQKGRETDVIVTDTFGAAKDPELQFLSQSLDQKVAERCLFRMLSANGYESSSLNLLNINVIRHKPGRRCIVEYEVELARHQKKNKIVKLLGKARAKGVDTTTYDLCCKLWDSGFNAECTDGVSIPQPVGIVPEMQMWFQRKVPGTPVINILKEKRDTKLSGRIAEALHKLHVINFACRKKHTMDDELYILHNRLQDVARQNPHWEQRVKRLLDACDKLGASIPSCKPTGIHRDFYFDQVIVNADRLFLLDLDMFCEGDPGLDIGNFIGHLTEYGLRVKGNADALIDQETAMESQYLQLAGNRYKVSIQTYATLTLVRHIYISTQFPDRRPHTESLLEHCEQRLGVQQKMKV